MFMVHEVSLKKFVAYRIELKQCCLNCRIQDGRYSSSTRWVIVLDNQNAPNGARTQTHHACMVDQWLERRTGDRGSLPIPFIPCYYCLSDESLNTVGPLYLVSMPGKVKHPTHVGGKFVTCRELLAREKHCCVSPRIGCLEQADLPKTKATVTPDRTIA